MTEKKVYSVSQINSYVHGLFDNDFILRNLYVRGEISNCKYHTSGHIYFSLKDVNGVIACVMWRSDASNLKFRLQDGMEVVAHGSVGIYEAGGKYQIYVRSLDESGKGDLARQFEELKKRLEEKGMFDDSYKQAIPPFSMNIGVVTAQTGAVIRDIFNVASRRNPYCQITLFPALVQGEGAPQSIVRGIRYLDNMNPDVIIIGRGGGSMEDLWAFNDEEVANAIFACRTPVISAVGHETDFTIADFVADLRAPTPSAAAELAVFDYQRFLKDLDDIEYSLKQRMQNRLEKEQARGRQYALKMETLSPVNRLIQKKQLLEDKADAIETLMNEAVKERKNNLRIFSEKLEGLSPLKRLSEGYSFVTDSKGKALIKKKQVKAGDFITVNITDGKIGAKVDSIEKAEY